MSEKRFVYNEEYFPLNVREILDNKTGKTYDCEDATDVLNEMFDENEQLKAKVKRLQDIATRTEAEKEEYADLYCKCENELIKNGRRCFFKEHYKEDWYNE